MIQLRYEPLPHKNTLGFWTRAEDWASWEFEVHKPGVFTVTVDLARLEWLRDELDRRVDGTLPWRTKPGIFKQWIRPELYRGYERL